MDRIGPEVIVVCNTNSSESDSKCKAASLLTVVPVELLPSDMQRAIKQARKRDRLNVTVFVGARTDKAYFLVHASKTPSASSVRQLAQREALASMPVKGHA